MTDRPFRPAYLDLLESGELDRRVGQALEELRDCRVCPRDCEIDRLAGEVGVCRSGRHARVASFFPHFGEEDCLRGWNGSGTIFFAWCNLRCVFCQNYDISQRPAGEVAGPEDIAAMALDLQAQGCHNLNFVTPEHVAPQVIEAVAAAPRPRRAADGLRAGGRRRDPPLRRAPQPRALTTRAPVSASIRR